MEMRYAPCADEACPPMGGALPWVGHLLTGKVKLCV